MDVEFDTAKDAANLVKHGVSLSFGARVFDDGDHVVFAASRPIDREDRLKAIGTVDGKLWTAVYVLRGTVSRFISVRRSNAGEQGAYHRDPG